MKKRLLPILLTFTSLVAWSQGINVTGKVMETDTGEPLIGTTILFVNVKDSTASKFTTSGLDGSFIVKDLTRAFYKISIRSVGYKPYSRLVRLTQTVSLGVIGLEPDVEELEEVVIESDLAVIQKGDTTVFRAGSFKTNPDATAADLVSKMPGIVISDTGVESNGESINQVLLDGKRFFGQDPLLALNTIPAEVVNEVEVFDQQSERSRMSGFEDGNTTKTMNVVTKENKRQGEFGRFVAGMGSDSRYMLEGNLNSFKKNRQLTILGMSNDINKTEFSTSDITGSRSGSGRRGGNRFSGGAQQTPTGITGTNTFGFNYSNEKPEKWQLETSYFFDRENLENSARTQRETFIGDFTQEYDEENASESLNSNHRFNLRGTYEIDPNNSLLFSPSLTLQDNESVDFTEGTTSVEGSQINQTINNFLSETQGYTSKNNLVYSHKFGGKTGRTFLLDMNVNRNSSEGQDSFQDLLSDSSIVYNNKTYGTLWSAEPSFSEPVGTSSKLQFSYLMSRNNRAREVEAFEFGLSEVQNRTFISALSNRFESIATIHQPSIALSKRSFSNFFTFQLALQATTLENGSLNTGSDTFTNRFMVLLPSAFGRIPISDEVSMFFRYSTQTGLPTTNQLQEVIDNSNPLFFAVGNEELDQSYTHQLFVRIGKTNTERNTSLSNFIILRQTNDIISSATLIAQSDSLLADGVVLPRGAQLTSPINLDGFWNLRNTTTYSFVLTQLKLNLSANLGVGYTKNPGLINNELNTSETYNLNSRLTIASNISKNVDFNVSYTYNANKVENTIQSRQNSNFFTHTIGGKMNITLPGNFVLRSDLNYQYYDGISDDFNTTYALWNASVAKKFLKNNAGELTFTAFDLLNQNQSITQDVTASYFQERNSLVLQQYFMVSLMYTLRSFN
ncbi:MAG: outer membrane beta-barrel protein [Bacteroidota bacterium]